MKKSKKTADLRINTQFCCNTVKRFKICLAHIYARILLLFRVRAHILFDFRMHTYLFKLWVDLHYLQPSGINLRGGGRGRIPNVRRFLSFLDIYYKIFKIQKGRPPPPLNTPPISFKGAVSRRIQDRWRGHLVWNTLY